MSGDEISDQHTVSQQFMSQQSVQIEAALPAQLAERLEGALVWDGPIVLLVGWLVFAAFG
jgi:hypothetical protein